MSSKNIKKSLNNFRGKKVGVVGDVMLDVFLWGTVDRVSPEAPIPVVLINEDSSVPGGAGNVALNISTMGGDASVLGVVGDDQEGKLLRALLDEGGINTESIYIDSMRPTTQKERIIAQKQQIVRIDKESDKDIRDGLEKKVITFLKHNIPLWDVVTVADYGKGFITKKIAKKIVSIARKHKIPIIVDTKPSNAKYYENITLITPNHTEAFEISGEYNVGLAGKKLQKIFKSDVLVTQGCNGATLFAKNSSIHFKAYNKEPVDVSGAGDTVVAALALAVAGGFSIEDASHIANCAAAAAVRKKGTSVVDLNEIKKFYEYKE